MSRAVIENVVVVVISIIIAAAAASASSYSENSPPLGTLVSNRALFGLI